MASLGRPGDVLDSGAIVGAAPGQLILGGMVFLHKSRLRRAQRLGWSLVNSVVLAGDEKDDDIVVVRR